ncbi:SpaA isopeptide-forming pilin-related protein [Flavonifractor plautii]|uniref:SpaA isopeptide-forming pilin-related protein n=1 Tax=Flavonifractor plautii TaxID=292800 RepID=UPI00210AC629|nr:SpaA isopeptide-forming pilin-related protein [Flavonifractor plautii]MCQ5309036.1 SpaA isopeptide-forming pilin-related protein [Flavonifractor plautii]
MKKRLIALLLVLVTVLGMLPTTVLAASSEEEALGEVNIHNGGQKLSYLSINGRVRELIYTYFNYVDSNGRTKEIPAYCVNPNTKGVPQTVAPGESIKYIAKEKGNDPKVMGIVANGYPTRGLGELKLENRYHAYYATKMALWCYLLPNWNINNLKVNPNLTGKELQRAQAILAAAKDIYVRGTSWSKVLSPRVTATADRDTAYAVTVDGQRYKQQVFTVHSDTWVCDYAIRVAFSDPASVPAGTRIVDMNNKDITTITTSGTGDGYDGKFKVLYPAAAVAGKTGSVQLSFSTNVYQYAVFYATCAEVNKYGQLQNYMCDTDPTTTMRLSTYSNYSDGEKPEVPDTGLKITKLEKGTDTPLGGAIFEVVDPDGATVGTFSTGSDGTVSIPLTLAGNYTVYERVAPLNHLLSDTPAQNIKAEYGKVAEITFWNEPYGTLRVEKLSDTGAHLPGAMVQIKHIESGVTYTAETNFAGYAIFDNIKPGAYEIKEITAPSGWLKDDATYTATVSTGETTTFSLVNKELPGLRIIKYDRKNMVAMANVTFEIFRDGVSLGKYQTDEFGEILLTNVTPGTYRAVEVDTGSDGHILNTTPQEVELSAGDGIRELLFFNDVKPGLKLVKVDSTDPSKVIPNAVFEIKSVKGDYGPEEFVTDQNGEIDLSKLPTGAYVVTEKSCNGYVIDDAQRIIQLDPNEDAQFVFTNTIKPSLEIIKTSSDGSRLKNVSFRISRIEDGTHYLDRTTNEQGEILISDLEPGVYSVKETATDSSHILDLREYHVELFPGKVSTLTIENQKRPNLTVYKHDADTGEPIADTVFEVRAADGHSVDQIKTDKDGKAELRNLLPGVYEIIEKSVPSPYLLDAPSQLATLYPNRDHTVYFENHQKPSLTVKKVDSVTGDPLPGAKFQVTYASNNTSSGEINDLGTFYTAENGQFQLTGLRDGWYKISELEPPTGYSIKEATQEVYIKSGTSKTLTFENIPLSALVVWKYDSVTGEAVSNAVFQVKYLTGTSGTGGTVIGTYKTSANGSFTVTGLKEGTYIVEEISSDSGHVIDTAPQTVYISGKQQDVVQLYFGNSPKGNLLVKKIDSVTHKPLSDVEFFVTTADGTVVGDANGKYITDSAGSFTVSNIAPGTTLVVKETRARDGYLLDDAPQTATVKAGQTVTLEFRNQPQGGLIIHKLDAVTKKPLEGVRFKITYADGSFVDNGTLSSKGLYRTDKNGQIILSGITGTVIVTEVETIKGYRIDDASRSQTIEVRANDTQTLWFYNAPTSRILLHKVDKATGKGIYGAVFLLYDSNHNPIGEYVTDQDGYIYADEGLADGRYYLREIKAAQGYVLDPELKTIYVRAGSTTEIEWSNSTECGQIQIIKKSADDNPTNGLPAGTLLEGAVFEVYDKAGNIVDTIKSDRNGRAVSKTLPLSRYTIREVQAPAYYSVNPTVMTAYLEFNGQIVTFEVQDSSISTGVGIKKTGPVQAVPGQPIRYVFSEIKNSSTVALDSFYWRDQLPAQVTLNKIVTGSYNQPLSYKVVYRTNLSGDYRTLADNLSTSKVYVLDARPAVLGLAANERVTEVMFVFGNVKTGFVQVETPYIYATARSGLANNSSIVNVADVGGRYNGQWIQAVSRWLTTVYAKTTVKLPKTGY